MCSPFHLDIMQFLISPISLREFRKALLHQLHCTPVQLIIVPRSLGWLLRRLSSNRLSGTIPIQVIDLVRVGSLQVL